MLKVGGGFHKSATADMPPDPVLRLKLRQNPACHGPGDAKLLCKMPFGWKPRPRWIRPFRNGAGEEFTEAMTAVVRLGKIGQFYSESLGHSRRTYLTPRQPIQPICHRSGGIAHSRFPLRRPPDPKFMRSGQSRPGVGTGSGETACRAATRLPAPQNATLGLPALRSSTPRSSNTALRMPPALSGAGDRPGFSYINPYLDLSQA